MTAVAAGVTTALCCALAVAAAPPTSHQARLRLSSLALRGQVAVLDNPAVRRTVVFSACAVITAGCVLVSGLAPTIALVAVVAAAGWAIRRARSTRREADTRAAVVELCRATAAELRAGQPAGRALLAGAEVLPPPARKAVAPALAAARHGAEGDLAELLTGAAAQPGLTGLRRFAACWRVAAGAGTALAPALDRIADGLQDEIEVRRDIATALAAPRATVRLLAVLPAVGLLLGTAIGADPGRFLLGSAAGLGCLGFAVALNLGGLAWAGRIAGAAARPRRS